MPLLTPPKRSTLVKINSVLMPNYRSRSLMEASHTSLPCPSAWSHLLNTLSTIINTILSCKLHTSSRAPVLIPMEERKRNSLAPWLASSSMWQRAVLLPTPSSQVLKQLSMALRRLICASSLALLIWLTTGAMMAPSLCLLAHKVSNGVSSNRFNPSPRHSLTGSRVRGTLRLLMVITELSSSSILVLSTTAEPPNWSLALQLLSLPLPPLASDERHQTKSRFLHLPPNRYQLCP